MMIAAVMADFDETELLLSTFTPACGVPTVAHPRFISSKNSVAGINSSPLLAPLAEDSNAAGYFAVIRRRVAELLQQGTKVAAVQVLNAGVQCLEGFVQLNLCGPVQGQHVALWEGGRTATATATATAGPSSKQAAQLGQDSLSADERWVASQLQVDGEDLVSRAQALDLLLAALLCIAEPCGCYTTSSSQQQQQQQQHYDAGGSPGPAAAATAPDSNGAQQQQQLGAEWLTNQQLGSWSWWAMRVVMMQQYVLHGKSNTLRTALQRLTTQTLSWVHSVKPTAHAAAANAASSNHAVLLAAAHLECSLVYQHYGQVAEAEQQLAAAAAVLGVEVQVTGALGFRTKHQLDPKAQLVASVTDTAAAAAAGGKNSLASSTTDGVDIAALGFDEVGLTKELEGMEDASAVYLAPRLAAGSADTAAASDTADAPAASSGKHQQQRLSCMLQALLLGWAAQIKKGTSKDELQQWQMAPFVEAVLQQQSTQYMLHATARLLKCRHEKERGRTRERALMQLEQLCNALQAGQPGLAVRMPYCFAVRFPLWPLLQKELAELYIAMGFVGAALRIFESLEMWDQLTLCYRLLDKKQVAQELVLQRLQASPDDAKLWCVLGDIQQQEQHYIKAWEVSGHRNSRAQRSLAKSALQKKEFDRAAAAYELALGLNPLYPDAWFALGYCYLKMGENSKALQAFTKVTHLEPDHGEAWTNLAALWLQRGGAREALHASEQAIKYKRDSWQTWENYATAAAKAGVMPACVRALSQVFELTKAEHLSLETVDQLMKQLEQEHRQLQEMAAAAAASANPDFTPAATTNGTVAATPAAATGGSEEEEVMEAPEQLLRLLAVSDGLQLPDGSSSSSTTLEGTTACSAEAAAHAVAARQRSFDQVMSALGTLLKSAANAAACGPSVWGLLGRFYGLQGQLLSSQEAYLKQVRALQSSPYKSDPDAFTAMASATEHLCRAYLATAAAGQGGLRELSAARMQLRGLLKQSADLFEEQKQYRQLEHLLQDVLAAEDVALAAKKAAEAAA